jgi:hypothetical protein
MMSSWVLALGARNTDTAAYQFIDIVYYHSCGGLRHPPQRPEDEENRARQSLPGQACATYTEALFLRIDAEVAEAPCFSFWLRPHGCVAIFVVECDVLQSVLSRMPGPCLVHDRV